MASVLLIGCKSSQPMPNTPSDVLKRYVAASQAGDIDTMKSLLSKGSLDLIEKSAKSQIRRLTSFCAANPPSKFRARPKRAAKLSKATRPRSKSKNETNGNFDMKMPFVKENGAWKIARDKYIEEELKKASEEINKKLANSSLSNSNSAPNANLNTSENK